MNFLGLQCAQNRFFAIFSITLRSIFVLISKLDLSHQDKQLLFFDR